MQTKILLLGIVVDVVAAVVTVCCATCAVVGAAVVGGASVVVDACVSVVVVSSTPEYHAIAGVPSSTPAAIATAATLPLFFVTGADHNLSALGRPEGPE